MKTSIAIVMCAVAICAAADRQLDELINDGLKVKADTDAMTRDDVPKKWQSEKTTMNTDRGTETIWRRGDTTVLTISWLKSWQGAKARMFTANACDGTNVVCRIAGFPDSTSVMKGRQAINYDVITTLKTNGEFSLLITGKSGFMEKIIVQGRESHLLDDLEYTKSAVLMEGAIEPLVDGIKNRMERAEQSNRP